ncbi:MAG: ABC transporter ATP-binding protein [Anaerolineaceae bacterium]|nr:ABC transporter ATP-binding protein [Anaerolineaceae bacterium]
MENITKRFPGVLDNDHVTVDIARGEIHALLGENGAGKTTLMNILYGLYHPDAGNIFVNDRPVTISSPLDAISKGVGMIHQHFMLIPVFTVAENIALGEEMQGNPFVDLELTRKRILDLSKATGLHIDPDARVEQLSVGDQQRVEIIKALLRGVNVLIMDEPTSVLTPQEADELFVVLRKLAEEGKTIIFITHKLREVMAISDRITILRGGKVVNTVNTREVDRDSLANMMVGRKIFLNFDRKALNVGNQVLELKNVSALNDRGLPALKEVSLAMRAGEILGVAGVDGNGQSELADVIMGLRPVTHGDIIVKGRSVVHKDASYVIKQGISAIPFSRHEEGLVLTFSVKDNLILKEFYNPPFSDKGLLDFKVIQDNAQRMIKEYDIRTTGPDAKVGNMSGGNQQKVVLAREISRKPDILIACQPTHGLDIGATEYVRQQLLNQRDSGISVMLISTELEEILSLSDRIIVMYEGQIMGEVPAEQADLQEIGKMMLGVRLEAAKV